MVASLDVAWALAATVGVPLLLCLIFLCALYVRGAMVYRNARRTPHASNEPDESDTWAEYPHGQNRAITRVNGKHTPTSSDERIQP